MRSPARNRWSYEAPATATYRLTCSSAQAVPRLTPSLLEVGGLEVDLFREWFHYVPGEKTWYPDALIPLAGPVKAAIPDTDNKVPGQRTQAFWMDVWIPKTAKAGAHEGRIVARSGTTEVTIPIRVEVLDATIPAEDVVLPDHNSYGTSWLTEQYPQSKDLFRLIHAHHRIFYEHRGVFHQLGYGHGGKVAPEFAPEIEGTGRSRRVKSWDLYDRHYGPLFDGSAFVEDATGCASHPVCVSSDQSRMAGPVPLVGQKRATRRSSST